MFLISLSVILGFLIINLQTIPNKGPELYILLDPQIIQNNNWEYWEVFFPDFGILQSGALEGLHKQIMFYGSIILILMALIALNMVLYHYRENVSLFIKITINLVVIAFSSYELYYIISRFNPSLVQPLEKWNLSYLNINNYNEAFVIICICVFLVLLIVPLILLSSSSGSKSTNMDIAGPSNFGSSSSGSNNDKNGKKKKIADQIEKQKTAQAASQAKIADIEKQLLETFNQFNSPEPLNPLNKLFGTDLTNDLIISRTKDAREEYLRQIRLLESEGGSITEIQRLRQVIREMEWSCDLIVKANAKNK